MSYILDALQRADAERARGGVPGLHDRQVVATALPQSAVARLGNWWLLAGVAAVAAVAGGIWLARAPVVAPAPAVAESLTPREAVVATQTRTPAPAPAPAPPPAPIGVAPPALTATPALESPVVKARPVAPVTQPVQTPTAAVKPAPVAMAIPWFADLPQELRQHIPKLAITGTVYSENPAQRLLVVNGQVLTQGSEVTPELSLAEIHPTNSDFIFRGTRFRLPH